MPDQELCKIRIFEDIFDGYGYPGLPAFLEVGFASTTEKRLESARRLLGQTWQLKHLAALTLLHHTLEEAPTFKDEITEILTDWRRPIVIGGEVAEILEPLEKAIGINLLRSLPGPTNAFGFLDPDGLPKSNHPQLQTDLNFTSSTTIRIAQALDQLLISHFDEEFTYVGGNGKAETTTLRKKKIPYVPFRENERAYKLENEFPLFPVFERWWNARAESLRDEDGFELERLVTALNYWQSSRSKKLLKDLTGVDEQPNLDCNNLLNLVTWLISSFPLGDGIEDFRMRSAEHALAYILSDRHAKI